MDNPMQGSSSSSAQQQQQHHNHVYDPALAHLAHNNHHPPSGQMTGVEGAPSQTQPQPQPQASASASTIPSNVPALNPDGTPVKRRPGRPKGSTKKNLLAGSPMPPKIKRPVGRPRKDGLPAGSMGSTRVKRERNTPQTQGHGQGGSISVVQYGTQLTGVGYPPVPYGYSISAPVPASGSIPVPAIFQIDPSLEQGSSGGGGDNEWAELARTNPNAFLSTLLGALAAPNPVSSAGPTVEEAFKSHLVSLAPNPTQMQPIPSLYSILKTFWLPSSPAYFSLTASASTARTPSEHRFLYWDPQPLVFNGIACPSCAAPLINKGRISSGPVKIYDIEKPFFIVGCEYVCRSPACVAATSSSEGRKFASTDPSILRSLPVRLKDEFPARLLYGDADAGSGPNVWNWKAMGVSTGLWNLVMGALRAGLKKEVILGLIFAVQHGVPDLPGDSAGGAGVGQQQQQGHQQQQVPAQNAQEEDERMEEEEDGGREDQEEAQGGNESAHGPGQGDAGAAATTPAPGSNETQTLSSSTTFSDAYGDAWKENTAMAESVALKQMPATAQAPSTTPAPSAATPQAPPTPAQPLPPVIPATTGYNPYHAYPFVPYAAYMPHTLMNGHAMLGVGQLHPTSTSNATVSGSSVPPTAAHPNPGSGGPVSGSGSGVAVAAAAEGAGGSGSSGAQSNGKRSPRHCCKCGSQVCKGKGGRGFCMNKCQDCGELECRGRNSRRPDKKCTEAAWP